MTFISFSISLKTSNILESKSLCYNELKIQIKLGRDIT